jgi:hypothetical protein
MNHILPICSTVPQPLLLELHIINCTASLQFYQCTRICIVYLAAANTFWSVSSTLCTPYDKKKLKDEDNILQYIIEVFLIVLSIRIVYFTYSLLILLVDKFSFDQL